MKILFTWHAAVEPEYRKLFDAIAASGHDLTVIAPDIWYEGGKAQTLQADLAGNYKLLALHIIFKNRLKGFFYSNIFRIAREIKALRPDVVHIFEEPYALSSLQFTALSKVFSSESKILVESFENIFIKQKFPYSLFEKAVLKMSDCIIAIPGEGKAIWESKCFRGELRQVPVGLDEGLFKKIEGITKGFEFLASRERIRIAYIGRLTRDKGIDLLIEAASMLQKDGLEFELLIVGSGDKEPFKRLAMEKGIDQKVFFHGPVDSKVLPFLYSKTDILVLPSRTTAVWKEQFGRVLIEAMACETVVVGSSSGEIPAVIGDAGLVFKEDDASDLANALRRLLSNDSLRRELSMAGRARVMRYFTWKAVAKRLISIYEEVIK